MLRKQTIEVGLPAWKLQRLPPPYLLILVRGQPVQPRMGFAYSTVLPTCGAGGNPRLSSGLNVVYGLSAFAFLISGAKNISRKIN